MENKKNKLHQKLKKQKNSLYFKENLKFWMQVLSDFF